MLIKNTMMSFRNILLSFRTYVRNLSVGLSLPGVSGIRRSSCRVAIFILFLFTFNSLAFAEEKIPVFPTSPIDAYTIYASLAVFWLAIIGLIVVIKMKVNEIERIQKLGIDKEDKDAPMLK